MWKMVGAVHSFSEHGRDAVQHLVRVAELTPSSTVLDIGCGLGKHAAYFAEFLKPPGRYEGFDVEPLSIRWCKLAIASRYQHAHFRRVSLRNAMYNPRGRASPSRFRFPYQNDTFDLVYLESFFTHMFHDDVRRYLFEISRVLKPGGTCIASVYLLNEDKLRGIAAGTAAHTFAIPHRGSWIQHAEPAEGAVAHEEAKLLTMLADAGLELAEPREYGSWAEQGVHHQDTIRCTKPAARGSSRSQATRP